ncbi:MAG: DUF4333 domain-containing protein [Acaryochloridaceae cyanobacterium SU_2_1]|nr:DUF4333 domain-containing protein [Acaryochloridaceae cyanobacterium SU_2_1]
MAIMVGCVPSVDLKPIENKIKAEFETKTGRSVKAITCEPGAKQAKGERVSCDLFLAHQQLSSSPEQPSPPSAPQSPTSSAQPDRTPADALKVEVELTDNQGNFNWKLQDSLINVVEVEAKIKEEFDKQRRTTPEVDCQKQLIIARADNSFTCTVEELEYGPSTVKVTVKDGQGTVDFELVDGPENR